MSTETQKVDVLAVLEAMIDERRQRAKADVTNVQAMAEYAAANEVYANVAELIEAVKAIRATRGGTMALGAQDERTVRLWNALARVGGDA